MDLLVQRTTTEAVGVLGLHLVHPDGELLPEWQPGAHIDVTLPSGRIRQYSLCSNPTDRTHYRIGVLREEHGRGGSLEVHNTHLTGTTMRVSAPRNRFPLVPADRYLFIAGGIGITPILAMLGDVTAPWQLIYGGRSLDTMAFRQEIADLQGGTTTLVPQDIDGLLDLEEIVGHADNDTAIYCCGPDGLLQAVEQHCAARLPPGALHLERFGAPPNSPPQNSANCEDSAFEVELARTGVTLSVPPDKTVLETVLERAPQLDYSCEEGYCGTCETRVLAGVPLHRDTVLDDAERDSGNTMMICVSRSKTPKITLDL
ncbi:ferredoxin (plasmid) [Pseudonocardia sp. EC080610-09]|nr:ferredoxin [Pseudonocardia sp. EC080610-09]ALL85745.1 ferredoxin [Pseudonocardia sp. EC080619-01]